MSINVRGIIYFTHSMWEVREKLSFEIQKAALENGFCITFERECFLKKPDKNVHILDDNCIFFEINDSPLIRNCENLFSVNIWSDDSSGIVNESVDSRMKRIEEFLRAIISDLYVDKIFMEIDPSGGAFNDFDYDYHYNINADQFTDLMTTLYEKEIITVPCVQLTISSERIKHMEAEE